MKHIKSGLCLTILIISLLCGCDDNVSADYINSIEPMTKIEFDLTYKETMKSMLMAKFKEYTSNDFCINYKITRDKKEISGTYFGIKEHEFVEYNNWYYIKKHGVFEKLQRISVFEQTAVTPDIDSTAIQLKIPLVLSDILSNISKANLDKQSKGVENYTSGNTINELFAVGGNSGTKTDIVVHYLKNYITVNCTEREKEGYTKIELEFSTPTAIQHEIVEMVSTNNSTNNSINNSTRKNSAEN